MTDKITAIYVGRRLMQSGKVGHGFILQHILDEIAAETDPARTAFRLIDRAERKTSYFNLKRTPSYIGAPVAFEGEIADGRVVKMKGVPAFISGVPVKTHDLGAAWGEADRTVTQARDEKSFETKSESKTLLRISVDALKAQYKQIPPSQRRSFMLWLWDEMEKK